jgi:hypothetical protein
VAAEGDRVGCALPQSCVNCFQDTSEVAIHVVIPKSQDTKAGLRKSSVADFVACRVRIEIVLTAIDLHNEAMLQADKIHDEIIAGRLPAKMKPALSP